MCFNKKFFKGISLMLIVLMLAPGISYAKTFKDVPASHWAFGYIDKMSNLGYISGDPGGTFRPTDSLTYLETLTLLSKLLNIPETERYMVEIQRTVVKKYNVPEWAQEAVMKCLYKGVISEGELKTAFDNKMLVTGTKSVPNRLTISVYLAKAMGLDKIASLKTVVNLPYKDRGTIDTKYHNILDTLIDAKVLSPNGTGTGNFEPKSKIQRDAMATMLSNAYDYLQNNPTLPVNPVEPVEPSKPVADTETVKGTLLVVTNLGNNTFLTIKDRFNKEVAYLVDAKTSIMVDGRSSTISGLYSGQELEITVTKGTSTAVSINAEGMEEDISGTIKSITPSSFKLVVEYVKDRVNKTTEFTVDKDADITLNGKKANLYDLKAGDAIEVYVKNNVVKEIEATAKSGKAEGEISDIRIDERASTTRYYITLKDSKGNKKEYELDSKAYIYRNNKKAKVEDLRVGDMAYVQLDYDVIIDIDAEVVEKELEGFIVAISTRLNKNTEITIKNKSTGKEETYELSRNAVIKIDNKVAGAYDLMVGYYVEVITGGSEITEIYADSVSSEYLVRGRVKSISSRYYELEIIVEGSEIAGIQYGDRLDIRTSKDLIVKNYLGVKLSFKDIKEKDTVYVYGYYDGTTFTANEIEIR